VFVKPVHASNSVEAKMVERYKVKCCFDIVAVFGNNVEATGNKVASCFDIVAGVARASLRLR